jgi:tetratricopeptide (TPR) repeat protein
MGEFGNAFKPFVIAISLDPGNAEAHYGIGHAYVNVDKYREAIGFLKAALRKDPESPDAHYDLGLAYAALGNGDLARKELKLLSGLDPYLAKKLTEKIPEGMSSEVASVAQPPQPRPAVNETMRQPKQSAKRTGAGRKPARHLSYDEIIEQADSLVREGQYVQALSLAQEGIRLNPDDFRAYYYSAYALYKRELFDEAKPQAEQSRRLAPTDKQADVERLIEAIAGGPVAVEQVRIAERAAADGSAERAAEAYSKAFKAMPGREDIGLKAARLYSDQLNMPAESVSILKQILLRTQNPETSRVATDLLRKAEAAVRAQEESLAEQQQRQAEERRRSDEEARRQAEQRRREDGERQERERRAREEQERAARRQQLEGERRQLESDREDVQRDKNSEEEQAESEEERARRFDAEADRYDSMPYGQVSAVLARNYAKGRREAAERHRQRARELGSRLNEIDRKISRIDSQLSEIRSSRY